ncbi:MAG: two-component regulator propeller domain-containing protein, partial [Verrucomicrobiia bacterium]
HSMNQTPDGYLLVITSDGLGLLEKNGKLFIYNFEEGSEQFFQPPGAPYILQSGMVALNVGDRAHFFNMRRKEFIPIEHPSGRHCKLVGQLNNGNLCFITTDPRSPQIAYRLDLFDGKRFRHFMEATNTVALGTEVYFVKQVSSGDVWVGGEKALAVNRNGQWLFLNQESYQAPTGAISFLEIETNKLWFGTQDSLYEYDGKNWRFVKSNLGRVRSIYKSKNGTIWLATANGLYRYERGKWVVNGTQEGLPSSSIYSVFEDSSGKLWACTARGLSYFNPEADPDPPIVKINSPKDNATVSTEDTVTVSFSGMDKWKYTLPDRLLYSWRLSGSDWSEYREENTITLKGLNSGTYQVFVKAMDRNMNESVAPSMVEFAVIVPWYKDDRTMAIALIGAAVAVVLAGIAVNKHFQLKRSYAEVEQKVNERTRQLELATQQLLLSQKMTALGTLAAGIAHDFNNILSIIKGSAQIIEENIDNKEKVLLRVQRIKTAVEQGAGIVRAMLGFSKQNGASITVIDVNKVIEETIKLLGERFLREVPLHFVPASPLPKVLGIRDLLQQILLNLILNAADAIQETKGFIEITTGVFKELPSPLVLNPEPAEEYIFISVKDTGCGMTPEV